MAKNYKATLALAVTEAIASGIARAHLAGNGFELDVVLGSIKGLMSLSGDIFEQRQAHRFIQNIADESCKQLVPLFEEQRDAISEEGRAAVAQLLADTIGNDAVSAEVLVSHGVDGEKLADALYASVSEELKQFNEAEVTFFEKVLRDACRSLIKVAVTLPAFTPAAFASILASEAIIVEDVRKVLNELE